MVELLIAGWILTACALVARATKRLRRLRMESERLCGLAHAILAESGPGTGGSATLRVVRRR